MDRVAPFLPQEIIRNILERLPVKSLIRFQCVCKHWKYLFKTPSFITDHLHHSSKRNTALLFQRNDRYSDFLRLFGRDGPLQLYLLDRGMQVLKVENAPLIDSMSGLRVVGSSNGLLCIERTSSNYVNAFLLWNPAIREIIQVPGYAFDFEGDFYIGFGFSPILNDYKIVRIYVPFYSDESNLVQVYSLSTGAWKKIKFGSLEGLRFGSLEGLRFGSVEGVNLDPVTVTADGVIYWLGSKRCVEGEGENDCDLIVSFDMATEVFTLIPMPALSSKSTNLITVHDNKLALLSLTKSESYLIDLWVMEEGIGATEERWSWTRKYAINNSSDMLHPFCIWGNEIVCNVDEIESEANNDVTTVLSLLNLSTNELKKNVTTSRCGNEFSVIFSHVETLVPVGNIPAQEP